MKDLFLLTYDITEYYDRDQTLKKNNYFNIETQGNEDYIILRDLFGNRITVNKTNIKFLKQVTHNIYLVLEANTSKELSLMINKHVAVGFTLVGNMCVSSAMTSATYKDFRNYSNVIGDYKISFSQMVVLPSKLEQEKFSATNKLIRGSWFLSK